MLVSYIKKMYNRLMGSNFARSVMTLSSGTIISQVINFVGMPVLGRIYTPAAVGDYSLVVSNAGVISALASLGMMSVFLLPEKDDESKALCRLVTVFTLAITLVSVIFLELISPFFKVFSAENASYETCLVILFFYIIANTVYSICYAYTNRQKQYKVMFVSPIVLVLGNIISGILFGLLGWEFIGYSLSHILSLGLASLHLMYNANPYGKLSSREYTYSALLKKYKKFPCYQMPANLISNIGIQIPNLMITHFFSSAVLGMYSMAMKILSIPTTLLSTPINRVYFREASERYNRGENIGEFSFNILQTGIKIALIPMLFLVLFGEELFSLFLGKQWYTAGTFAAVLVLYQLVHFCYSCLSGHFIIIRKNHFNLFLSFYDVLSSLALYFLVQSLNISIIPCLLALSIIKISGIIIFQGIFLKMTGFEIKRYFLFVLKIIALPTFLAWAIRYLIKEIWLVNLLI